MYFINTRYNHSKRNFHGEIDWGKNHLTGNFPRYEYNLIFSSDFSSIKYGIITGFNKENEIKTLEYISKL